MDITQAYLLEKALGGSVDVEDAVVSSRTNLVAGCNPPKPPPPPVLDLALLLDIPDECVVRRAFSQTSMLHWWEFFCYISVCNQTISSSSLVPNLEFLAPQQGVIKVALDCKGRDVKTDLKRQRIL